jgi:hypothetical protein
MQPTKPCPSHTFPLNAAWTCQLDARVCLKGEVARLTLQLQPMQVSKIAFTKYVHTVCDHFERIEKNVQLCSEKHMNSN